VIKTDGKPTVCCSPRPKETSAYITMKRTILERKEKAPLDRQDLAYWSGYVAGVRDLGLLTNKQVKKLDDMLIEGEY